MRRQLIAKAIVDSEEEPDGRRSSVFKAPSTVVKASKRNDMIGASTPMVIIESQVQKESVKRASTKKVQVQAPPDLADEFPEPKVESWTLQFMKRSMTAKASAPDPSSLQSNPVVAIESPLTRAKRLEAENYKKQLLLQKSDVLKQQAIIKSRLVDEFSIIATPPPPTKTVTPTDPSERVGGVARGANPGLSVLENVEFVPSFAAKSRLPRPPPKAQTPVRMKVVQAASTSIDSEVPPDLFLHSAGEDNAAMLGHALPPAVVHNEEHEIVDDAREGMESVHVSSDHEDDSRKDSQTGSMTGNAS